MFSGLTSPLFFPVVEHERANFLPSRVPDLHHHVPFQEAGYAAALVSAFASSASPRNCAIVAGKNKTFGVQLRVVDVHDGF